MSCGGGDTTRLAATLDAVGHARLPRLLSEDACAALIARYDDARLFRSRVVMARHGYGQGEYRYFAYPLPDLVAELRARLYPPLARIANEWQARLGAPNLYPTSLEDWLAACHAAGQERPTPLLLRYGPGDYNRLHQDVYGPHLFPLQAAVLLSRPGDHFDGGEFVLTEQRPRQQARAEVVPLECGDAVVFPVRERPVASARGFARARVRHGVSTIRDGRRFTLGIIFHDAA